MTVRWGFALPGGGRLEAKDGEPPFCRIQDPYPPQPELSFGCDFMPGGLHCAEGRIPRRH
ncbi:MAG: hypothetical protein RLZZ165_1603 [Bacteroidota bacterium]|jgi:hypothetical protein